MTVFTIDTFAAPHHVATCNDKHAINLTIKVPESRFGHLEGLLGDPGAPPGELVGGNGTTYSMQQLALPWQSAAELRRPLPPVRPELAHQAAGVAVLLRERYELRQFHRPCISEQGAHRGIADPNDRRCCRARLQGRRRYQP